MTVLTGKRILVTGATGALGSRIAHELSHEGAQLVLSGRDSHKLEQLAITGERYAVDLDHPEAASALVTAILRDGPLDGIVIAHGVVAFGPIAELTDATLSTLTQLNHLGPMQLIRSAQRALADSASHGHEPFVVTISGVISELPTVGLAAYGAGKAGLLGFVRAAQRELKRSGIRLLDSRPPHTETGLASRAISGVAPTMPAGLNPDAVAERIVRAILGADTDVPTAEFTG
ncbi:MAG: SDR family NAD(P)-dependent oxidoreductase [Agromyces sp.]